MINIKIKSIVIPLVISQSLLYIGGSFALTKLLTDKILYSTQKFIPSTLSKHFNKKKITWGFPAALMLVGIPLFLKFNNKLFWKIYGKTFGATSNIFQNKVITPLHQGLEDPEPFKINFIYDE
jgi:hypothetical protein